MSVRLISRVRGDMTFLTADALSRQIACDVEEARTQLRDATEQAESLAPHLKVTMPSLAAPQSHL
ncbi:MAG: hypothetical protein U0361_04215 [Nitrospiraceae bacterium]